MVQTPRALLPDAAIVVNLFSQTAENSRSERPVKARNLRMSAPASRPPLAQGRDGGLAGHAAVADLQERLSKVRVNPNLCHLEVVVHGDEVVDVQKS